MKRLLLLLLLFLSGCTNKQAIKLGSSNPDQVWIYLCGLTSDFYADHEESNRKEFDRLGKELNVKFLAVQPPARCATFDNKLCWPYNTPEQLLETYRYIMNEVGEQSIAGFIGFSNGGFFLNALAQTVALEKPIISIGAAGVFYDSLVCNEIHLMISKADISHYPHAIALEKNARNSCLKINLVEYESGHNIPFKVLKKLLLNQLNMIGDCHDI